MGHVNHRRRNPAPGNHDKAMQGWSDRGALSGVGVFASIPNDFTNGNRGMAKSARGAKKFVRTRIRFHENAATQRLADEAVNDVGEIGMADEAETVPQLAPMPCIACGKQLESAANHSSFDHVPYAGTLFHTSGHYGSTVFDSFDGSKLEIVVCDACLKAQAERVRLRTSSGEPGPWTEETGMDDDA